SPISSNIQLGKMMGVSGTPFIVLGNGEMIRGYMPPAQLIQALENTGS
ncbi:MAG: thioredoxin fold domain-containing protein, partial [Gammaproteobacteria bacterium]|nr:thioredoxin fold domain-containing protein [Gammaproteobacteria bacterium]